MAKITIAGDAIVVTSTLKLEDIKLIEKYRPKELTLSDPETKELIYVLGTQKGAGSINDFSASFGRTANDGTGLACITMTVDGFDGDDIKEFVADKIGGGLMQLNKIEERLPAVLEEIAAQKAAILDNITVSQ